MTEVSVEKRFRGSVRLLTLLLWRVGKSTDLDECFAAARAMDMITADNETFMRRCFALDAQMEAGKSPAEEITMDMVDELQTCTLRVNTVDPA